MPTSSRIIAASVATICLVAQAAAPGCVSAQDAPGTAPVSSEIPMLKVPYTRFQLENGLTVILHEDHSIPRAAVNIWYHVGSASEVPGRTGFAHLFEHLMFEGSAHVPEGAFDNWLEAAGGQNNGSTTQDRTNYWIDVPSNALELALFLESDRMGWLLETMSPERVDGQRDVVKNERRQSYENRPYGLAWLELWGALFPAGHPYSWPVIGSMEDLTAASHQDVVDFFQRHYAPSNASLVVAGDIDPGATRALVAKWFGAIPARPVEPARAVPPAMLESETRRVLEDQVQLPKLMVYWPTAAAYAPADAALTVLGSVLADGKNSRLYRKLVYDLQVAQDVSAYQYGLRHAGIFGIEVTARPGHDLDEMLRLVDGELEALRRDGVTARETERVVNQYESGFLGTLERVGGFDGKADALNAYWTLTGNPDYFAEDLARFKSLHPSDVQEAAGRWLGAGRVVMSVVPAGATRLAVGGGAADGGTR